MEFPTTSIVMMLLLAGGMYYGQMQFKKKRAEWGKTLTIGCAMAIIVLTIWTNLFRSPISDDARIREQQYQAIQATILANNLATMYSGKGKCLVIHQPNYSEATDEHVERMVNAFQDGFQNRVSEIRAVPIRDVTPGGNHSEEEMSEFTAADFNKVIQANSDCDMLILLVPPPFSEAELFEMDPFLMIEDPDNPNRWIKDPQKDYPLVGVFNGFIGNSETLFHDKLLGAMTMWRPNPVIDEEPVPDDKQVAFEKRYMMITKNNIEDIRSKYPNLFPKER